MSKLLVSFLATSGILIGASYAMGAWKRKHGTEVKRKPLTCDSELEAEARKCFKLELGAAIEKTIDNFSSSRGIEEIHLVTWNTIGDRSGHYNYTQFIPYAVSALSTSTVPTVPEGCRPLCPTCPTDGTDRYPEWNWLSNWANERGYYLITRDGRVYVSNKLIVQ